MTVISDGHSLFGTKKRDSDLLEPLSHYYKWGSVLLG